MGFFDSLPIVTKSVDDQKLLVLADKNNIILSLDLTITIIISISSKFLDTNSIFHFLSKTSNANCSPDNTECPSRSTAFRLIQPSSHLSSHMSNRMRRTRDQLMNRLLCTHLPPSSCTVASTTLTQSCYLSIQHRRADIDWLH